jgi:DNA end-binding protein Ku
MPRALWSGAISFGLVNVPVRMYPAIAEKDLHFHLLHEPDASRIEYRKVCAKESKTVADDEIVKGYELDDGSYVYLTDDDFRAAESDSYKLIEIRDFVPYEQIDPIVFERTYFLGPAKGAEKVYSLLVQAMEQSDLAAITSYVFHDHERLGCLRVRERLLALERMYFADEIRPVTDIAPPRQRKVDKSELRLAADLIERLTGDFDHGKYHDRHRERLQKVIRDKRAGKELHAPAYSQPEAPVDLMAALKESLEASKKAKTAKKKRAPAKRRRAA